jgi:hypothetical protein
MLKETKTDSVHYFVDEEDRYQGEYKSWWSNNKLRDHLLYVDDKLHGECKWWNVDGTLISHAFIVHGEVLYRDLLANPVTDEDKFLISLETGGGWLC